MKLYKSFKQLLQEHEFTVENNLKDYEKYFAHTKADTKLENYEKLHEHVELVRDVALDLVDVHSLEPIIENLINAINFGSTSIGNFIKLLFIDSIIFHDFGKINVNFQFEKMGSPYFKFDNSIKVGTGHSFLSAYIFLNYQLDQIYIKKALPDLRNQNIVAIFVFLFTIPILKHHSSFISKDCDFEKEKIASIHQFLKLYGLDISFDFSNNIITNEEKIWEYFNSAIKDKQFDYFALFALLKLNWSLLTAADYYATSEYMNGLKITNFGLIDDTLRENISTNIKTQKSYNSDLYKYRDTYQNTNLKSLQVANNQNLNLVRQKLGAHVIDGLNRHPKERLFYIEAPTGGGKTNLSMIAMSQLLQQHKDINKVFYVFPFTTLITQTYQSIKETLGLDEQYITQLHSKAGFKEKGNNSDGNYGKNLKNFITNVFVNYPITLLTHIRFFDILKANDKSSNYLLHRLANSIVVIDEIQAYNPKHWDKIKYFISKYAQYFNIHFIIMSATLPKIGSIDIGLSTISFQHLIPNAQKDYIQNPNFKNRVSIETVLLDQKNISIQELAKFVFDKSEAYAKERNDHLNGSVKTIIEFIFKKSATEFFNTIQQKGLFEDYQIFVLSGTILEPRRKEIIAFLKDEENNNQKVLLITTQVVEAGVDIDMDIGFKNKSLLDSDEQLAGRINRNVNKKGAKLWIFDHNEPKIIYGKDPRFEVAMQMSPTERKAILEKKQFDALYNRVFSEIEKNNTLVYKENFSTYISMFQSIDFQGINQCFRLIESDNISIFVPVNVPIKYYKDEYLFSKHEIDFLRKHKCLNPKDELKVSGERIWNLFIDLSLNKNMGFIQKSIELKKLNGIMGKFIFSIFAPSLENLKPYLEQNDNFDDYQILGFYKLNESDICNSPDCTEKVYSYISGLNNQLMQASFEFF